MLDYMMPGYMAVSLIIISILLVIAVYRLCTYYSFNWSRYKSLPGLYLIFTLSGASCSLIDVVFWGGSIDYIQLFNWFIFDLKDVYLSLGSVCVFLYLIVYYKQYYALSKEERKEYSKKTNLLSWLKAGLPLKPIL
jgi:signal peptidase II